MGKKRKQKKKEAETIRLTGQMKGLIFLLAVEAAVVCTTQLSPFVFLV